MTEKEITRALTELRAQIDQLATSDSAARDRLEALLTELEQKVSSLESGEHHLHVIEDIRETISEFEVEHPRLTGILNDIMVALSNLGI